MPSSDLRKRKGKNKNKDNDKKEKKVEKNKKEEKEIKGNFFQLFLSHMYEEVDASYLAFFRMMWGWIMAYEAWTYITMDYGKMYSVYYSSPVQFQYYGFEFCKIPADPEWLKLVFIVLFIAGIGITIGFFYKTCSLIYFILFTYTYVLEQSVYLNHFYLVCVLSLMMVLLPNNTCYSLDSILFPKLHSDTTHNWTLWVIRAELVIVYTFAGVAKMNEDWLRNEPLRQWVCEKFNTPYIGDYLIYNGTAWLFSYGGLIYDSIVGALLLYKPTLYLGIALTLGFHLTNKLVFNIGIFPWMMIASTFFFFDTDWPRYAIHKIRLAFGQEDKYTKPKTKTFQKAVFKPLVKKPSFKTTKIRKLTFSEKLMLIIAAVFLLQQLLTPLRHNLYEGTTAWNEYGHKFSWRMKLRTKKCNVFFYAYETVSDTAYYVPTDKILNRKQSRKVGSRPQLIIQYAHWIRDNYLINATNTEVYGYSYCKLNGRPWEMLSNGSVNLSDLDKWEVPYKFVTEISPLSDDLIAQYPWNWEWSWKSLETHIFSKGSSREDIAAKRADRDRAYQNQSEESAAGFEETITKRRIELGYLR